MKLSKFIAKTIEKIERVKEKDRSQEVLDSLARIEQELELLKSLGGLNKLPEYIADVLRTTPFVFKGKESIAEVAVTTDGLHVIYMDPGEWISTDNTTQRLTDETIVAMKEFLDENVPTATHIAVAGSYYNTEVETFITLKN